MKKTLVALAVTAFAASAYAVPVFENDTTKVDFWGSLRVGFDNSSSRTTKADGTKTKNGKGNTQLRNQGSRFGIDVKHQLGDGFYALGGTQIRFDDAANATSRTNENNGFGELHTRRVFVGLGKKELGQITFGEQLTLADDYGLTDDKAFGIMPAYITTEATSVAQYKYQGIEGLTLGANYNFKQTKNARGSVLPTPVKNEYGVGAVYQTNVAEDQIFLIEGGYGRTNYETGTATKRYHDGYELAVGYQIGGFRLFSDFGYKAEKNARQSDDNGKSTTTNAKSIYIAPGAWYQINDKTKVYANYLYENTDYKNSNAEIKKHGVLAFVEYKFHKNVSGYVEGSFVNTKTYNSNGQFASKTKDKTIATGLFVNW